MEGVGADLRAEEEVVGLVVGEAECFGGMRRREEA